MVEEAAPFRLAVQRRPVADLTPRVALRWVVTEAAADRGHDASELGHPFSPERLLSAPAYAFAGRLSIRQKPA
jgi:hypothetical protein